MITTVATAAGELVHPTITLGTPVIVGLMGVFTIWFKRRLDRQDRAQALQAEQQAQILTQTAQAAVAAALAAERSAPTGNGFAGRVMANFDQVHRRLDGLSDRLDAHIDRKA